MGIRSPRSFASALAALALGINGEGLPAAAAPAEPHRPETVHAEIGKRFNVESFTVQPLAAVASDGAVLRIPVTLAGESKTLELTPRSLRSPAFTVDVVDGTGGKRRIDPPPSCTYRGSIIGEPGSRLAASVRDGRIEAVIVRGDGSVWAVQPAEVPGQITGPGAAHVVYRHADVRGGDYSCGTHGPAAPLHAGDAADGDAAGGAAGGGGGTGGGGGPFVVQIAFDADVELFLLNGASVNATVADIENILNGVQTIYDNEVDVTYVLTHILVHISEPDPYGTTDYGVLLAAFTSHWNSSQADIARDVAHLMTGRDLDTSVIGVAYLGVICESPDQAYGLSQTRFSNNLAQRVALTAHEVGHNFNAQHCNGQGFCGIMCASLGGCGGNLTQFGTVPRNAILAWRDSHGCFSPPSPATKIMATDGSGVDRFATALAAQGGTLLAGARGEDQPAPDCGAAYLFQYDCQAWAQVHKFNAPDAAPEADFGAAVALRGGVAAIAADLDDEAGAEAGAVYIFRQDGGDWAFEQKITAADTNAGDQFGSAVALGPGVLAVGAPRADAPAPLSGAVYLFRRIGSAWIETQKLTASDGAEGDLFGQSLALDGEYLFIGAPFDGDVAPACGAAYVFRLVNGTWIQHQKLVPPQSVLGDQAGTAVALRRETAVIGARWAEAGQTNAGAAYVYRRTGSTWALEQRLTASDGAADEYFGYAIAIGPNVLGIGAYFDDASGLRSGSVYRFTRSGSTWSEQGKLLPEDGTPGDRVGAAVIQHGEALIAGAEFADGVTTATGAAYHFASATFDCNGNAQPDLCDLALNLAPDCNANGVPDSCDIATGFSTDLNGNAVPDDCEPAAACLGDCAGPGSAAPDGQVNIADLLALLGSWGSAGLCDSNASGAVDIEDLLALLGAWGFCP
jgi:hypothetical protein